MTQTVLSDAGGEPAHDNHRQSLRVRLEIPARLVLPDLTGARNIIVRDISDTGARLTVGEQQDLPKVFYLLLRAGRGAAPIRMECEVRWRVGPVAGVRFRGPLPEDLLLALTGLSQEAYARAS